MVEEGGHKHLLRLIGLITDKPTCGELEPGPTMLHVPLMQQVNKALLSQE